MKRKLYERLLKWKREDAGSCAVLIDGARRVGKSWIAEEFARMEYKSYLLIDCIKASDAFLSTPIVFHTKDVIRKDGIDYLPLYIVPCL